MAHYGLLRDYRFADIAEAEDIRGVKIYGRNDEKLGTIDRWMVFQREISGAGSSSAHFCGTRGRLFREPGQRPNQKPTPIQ